MFHPEIILVTIFVFISLYGMIRRNRFFFNLGYFLYGLAVFAAELNQYFDINSFSHLLFAILFLLQAILALPNTLAYDGGAIAKSSGVKIYSCLSIINTVGILVPYTSPAPNVTYYLHVAMTLFSVIAIGLILGNKIPIQRKA